MNPEQIPQMLRDIADALEQILGGAVGPGPEGAGAPPANLDELMAAQGGQPQ